MKIQVKVMEPPTEAIFSNCWKYSVLELLFIPSPLDYVGLEMELIKFWRFLTEKESEPTAN